MGKLLCLLLIVLGILGARAFIEMKLPASKKYLDGLYRYADYIGIAGLVIGILWLLEALMALRFLDIAPLMVIELWLAAGLMTALGLIFGWAIVGKIVGEPLPAFLVKVSLWRDRLIVHQKEIGLAAIAIGIIYLL